LSRAVLRDRLGQLRESVKYLARGLSVLVLVLVFSATASAECAWVLWGAIVDSSRESPHLWQPIGSFPRSQPCLEDAAKRTERWQQRTDAVYRALFICLPDTISVRGPDGKDEPHRDWCGPRETLWQVEDDGTATTVTSGLDRETCESRARSMQESAEWYVEIDRDIVTMRHKKATVHYRCRPGDQGPPEDARQ